MNQTANPGGTKFGGLAAIASGAFLFAAAGLYLLWPSNLLYQSADYQSVLLAHQSLYQATYIAIALSALFGIGAVLTIADRVQPGDRGAVCWFSMLAIVGFAVMAVNFMYLQRMAPFIAYQYTTLQQKYTGLGIVIQRGDDGKPWVAPFENGPTEKAGVLKGDVLLAVNGKVVDAGMAMDDILRQMREAPGDSVTLTVQTGNQPARDANIVRGEVLYWDTSAQAAMTAIGVRSIDPDYMFGFGLAGLWLLVINGLALRNGRFPKLLALLGIATGAAYWVFTSGFVFDVNLLRTIGQYCGLTLGPLWFVWSGIVLWRGQ